MRRPKIIKLRLPPSFALPITHAKNKKNLRHSDSNPPFLKTASQSSGPDTDDGCVPNPCSANAVCVDLFDGHRCECNYGFEANGENSATDGNACTQIPLVNECEDQALNTCHGNAICTRGF